MNLTKLREDHYIIIKHLDKITVFLNAHCVDRQRATITDLRQKLHLSKDVTIERLCAWVRHCNNHSTKQLYKLGVFFSQANKAPDWFNLLPISTVDTMVIRQTSCQLSLPGMGHVGTLYGLICAQEGGKEKLIDAITDARYLVVNALHYTGFVTCDTLPQQAVQVNDPSQRLGGKISNSEKLAEITLSHSWGYLTFDRTDELKENPYTADDLQILRGVKNFKDNVTERRLNRTHARMLIKAVTDTGLLFAGVRENYVAPLCDSGVTTVGTVVPVLVFVTPDELSIAISIRLDKYATIDKWVLDR